MSDPKKPDLQEEVEQTQRILDLQAALRRAQQLLAKEKDKTDELVRQTFDGARDAMLAEGPLPKVQRSKRDARTKGEEVALWHLTDWQGGKQTTSYNSSVMVERVENYWERAAIITEVQRQDHPVKNCVIMFGGDMVEGLFNFPTQPFEIDSTLFTQYVNVSRLIVRTVQQALSMYEQVEVVSEWGNHGRIGSRRDAVPRSDNTDRMCYELARQLLEGEDRLAWVDSAEDIQQVEIGSYRALLIHGDEVGRTGFTGRNTFISHANRWKSGAYQWDFRDVYVGHYHTHAEEPLADGTGSIYWTGSTESDNRYAGVMLGGRADPSQRLHFIDPARGRVTATYKVWV